MWNLKEIKNIMPRFGIIWMSFYCRCLRDIYGFCNEVKSRCWSIHQVIRNLKKIISRSIKLKFSNYNNNNYYSLYIIICLWCEVEEQWRHVDKLFSIHCLVFFSWFSWKNLCKETETKHSKFKITGKRLDAFRLISFSVCSQRSSDILGG